jgi:hypothetical protein
VTFLITVAISTKADPFRLRSIEQPVSFELVSDQARSISAGDTDVAVNRLGAET